MKYYLDIETTGLYPKEHKIVTIQYAQLEENTCKQVGDLVILKEWEFGGEKQLLEKFIKDTRITSDSDFAFMSVGYNLSFEHKFLNYKSRFYNLPEINIGSHLNIDLHTVGILINQGKISGSGLDKLTGKPHDGSVIPKWYKQKRYDKIEKYIIEEADEFIKFGTRLYGIMPRLRDKI